MPQTAPHKAAIADAKLRGHQQRQQRLHVGDFCVYRFDAQNLALARSEPHDAEPLGYYPTFKDALLALLPRLIERRALQQASDLRAVLAAVHDAETNVVAALATRNADASAR